MKTWVKINFSIPTKQLLIILKRNGYKSKTWRKILYDLGETKETISRLNKTKSSLNYRLAWKTDEEYVDILYITANWLNDYNKYLVNKSNINNRNFYGQGTWFIYTIYRGKYELDCVGKRFLINNFKKFYEML